MIEEKIRKYIQEDLMNGTEGTWDDETDIISAGILDSLSIVKLLVFLEDSFNVSLDDVLDIDNFRSIKAMAKTIKVTLDI